MGEDLGGRGARCHVGLDGEVSAVREHRRGSRQAKDRQQRQDCKPLHPNNHERGPVPVSRLLPKSRAPLSPFLLYLCSI